MKGGIKLRGSCLLGPKARRRRVPCSLVHAFWKALVNAQSCSLEQHNFEPMCWVKVFRLISVDYRAGTFRARGVCPLYTASCGIIPGVRFRVCAPGSPIVGFFGPTSG